MKELTGWDLKDVDPNWESKPFYPTFKEWASTTYGETLHGL